MTSVYEIEFLGFFESEKYEYVLAETFEEAFAKALKLLARRRKRTEDAEILSIEYEHEITDVKVEGSARNQQ